MTIPSRPPVVHVIEENARVRESIALTLLRHGWTVRAFPSERSLLDGIDPEPFGCLVLGRDESCSDANDPRIARLSRRIDLPVVFVGVNADARRDVDAKDSTARRLVIEARHQDELRRRVHAAVAWHAKRRLARHAATDDASRRGTLTRCEIEVLALLERDLSSRCIARLLDMGRRTVDVHRANVMRKMGVRSLAQLRRERSAAESADFPRKSGRGDR